MKGEGAEQPQLAQGGILHRSADSWIDVGHARYLAEHLTARPTTSMDW